MDEIAAKTAYCSEVGERYGDLERIYRRSRSLLWNPECDFYLYLLYSRVHDGYQAFYGIRDRDRLELPTDRSFLVFLRDEEPCALTIPFCDCQDLFRHATLASDGQFKVHLYSRYGGLELKFADVDAIDVTRYSGTRAIDELVGSS